MGLRSSSVSLLSGTEAAVTDARRPQRGRPGAGRAGLFSLVRSVRGPRAGPPSLGLAAAGLLVRPTPPVAVERLGGTRQGLRGQGVPLPEANLGAGRLNPDLAQRLDDAEEAGFAALLDLPQRRA